LVGKKTVVVLTQVPSKAATLYVVEEAGDTIGLAPVNVLEGAVEGDQV
jgi:hypothetical protein